MHVRVSASSFTTTCAVFIREVVIHMVVNRHVDTYMLDHTISLILVLLNIVRMENSKVKACIIVSSLIHKILRRHKCENGSLAGAMPARLYTAAAD
jgi:hypothetical protein